ncbi:MAG: YitT family protein [Erysipelotrichia bacterium]|nr:YitT family protein [Erysipelotrichia bacterium]
MKFDFKSIVTIILGNLIFAVSVNFFVLPYDVLSGGVAGIALIVNKIFNWNTVIVIDSLIIITFIMAMLFLGKEFTLKTVISSIVYPIFITLLSKIDYFIVADPILIAVMGGAIGGIGLSIVLKQNASTGGMDVPAIIIHNITHLPLAKVMFLLDSFVVLMGVISYSVEEVMLGIVYVYICNAVINKMIVPKTDSAVSLFIISDHQKDICAYIHNVLERGTTIINAKGGYTNENKEVIMTVISKAQYNNLEKEIEKIDKYAFVIISDAKEIKGEGFTYEYRV